MSTNIVYAVLIILCLVIMFKFPYLLLIIPLLFIPNRIFGAGSWKCINREAEFGNRCSKDKSDIYWPSRGICEDYCTYDYEYNNHIYKIKYPVPIQFIKTMESKFADFKDFLMNKDRFSKIARFFRSDLGDKLYDVVEHYIPYNVHIVRKNIQIIYAVNKSEYDQIKEDILNHYVSKNFDELHTKTLNPSELKTQIIADAKVYMDNLNNERNIKIQGMFDLLSKEQNSAIDEYTATHKENYNNVELSTILDNITKKNRTMMDDYVKQIKDKMDESISKLNDKLTKIDPYTVAELILKPELDIIYAKLQNKEHYCHIRNNNMDIVNEIQNFQTNKLTEMVIPITLMGIGNHANMLIYNKKLNQIFVFEPHVDSTTFNDKIKKECIQKFFNGLNLNPTIVSLSDYFVCPTSAHTPGKKYIQLQTNDSLCQSWTLFAMLLHLNNPDVPIEAIYGSIMNVSSKDYLIKFMYYMESQFKDINFYKEYSEYKKLNTVDLGYDFDEMSKHINIDDFILRILQD